LHDEALAFAEGYDFLHFLRIGVVFVGHGDCLMLVGSMGDLAVIHR
jgi:hypothetical protein